MKVTILDVRAATGSATCAVVSFRSDAGEGMGTWCRAREPEVGRTYDIEFTLTEPTACTLADRDVQSIRTEPPGTSFTGRLESVDDDVAVLRVATDCLILLERAAGTPPQGSFVRIVVSVDDLVLYPFGC
ncbi:MAG: hypothetical protein JWP97_6773 [Labilithrix sp.]|nr:hypothetical protein [Labilithrix sp.]